MYHQIVRSWTEDAPGGNSQAKAPIILGYAAPPDRTKSLPNIANLDPSIKVLGKDLNDSIKRVSRKANHYRMQGLVGTVGTEGDLQFISNSAVFNDLVYLDPTYRPSMFSVWKG